MAVLLTCVVVFELWFLQVLHEQLRYVIGTLFLAPHLAMKDGDLGGYMVPKGAQVWSTETQTASVEKHWCSTILPSHGAKRNLIWQI